MFQAQICPPNAQNSRQIVVKGALEVAKVYRAIRMSPYACLFRAEEAMGITLDVTERDQLLNAIADGDYL